MKSGVHVTHLIFEAGEVIKDERCSASCLHTHKKTKKKTNPHTKPLPSVLSVSRLLFF